MVITSAEGRLVPVAAYLFIVIVMSLGQGHDVKIKGDIYLGGLFPVHERGEKTSCGSQVYLRGFQRLEAMLFAVEKINSDPHILSHIKLGVNILDSCSLDTYALNQSLEFIRASINTIDTSDFLCRDGSEPKSKHEAMAVVGVVGGSYSSVSIQVANLLRLFRIPQISPASTALILSDKTRFDFFARTVPPDSYQAVALVDIIQSLNWSYVSTIASEGSYGESGIAVFHRKAEERNICIAIAEKIPMTADESVFESIIRNLLKKPNARGVVLFTRADDARGLLTAAKRLNLSRSFHWLASDGWGKQQSLVVGAEKFAEGAITVELQSQIIPGFDEYMKNLTPKTNYKNPWFNEYWEYTFNCRLPKPAEEEEFYSLEEVDEEEGLPLCKDSLSLSPDQGFYQESKVQFVVNAVYAFAHALHALHKDVCHEYEGVCPVMRNFDRGKFYKEYLLNVSFIDLAGSLVQFDEVGDGLARYEILNYQKLESTSHYDYKVIGKWTDKKLYMDPKNIIWNKGSSEIPTSVCSLPCETGHIKIMQHGDTCCWVCGRCEDWEYVYDEFTCKNCGPGRWPYPNKTECYDLDRQYMRWNTLYAIIPISISCLGILLTLIVMGLFMKNNETPIVKASGRELSYMILSGILISYLNTFALLAKPSMFSCVLQRFSIGVSFSIIYSALLTKTNRISRIFYSASKSARRPSFISPKSQVIITCSLISVQLVAVVVWVIVEPPGIRFEYPRRDQVILKCRISDSSFLVSLVYNMLLITVCTVYAVKTRKIPENFNESKFIGFTMYTTCIIWLAFVPLYFGTGNSFEVQITTQCVAISLSASVVLFCLYSPKIYIIVFHPDKNVRKLTMNSNTYRKAIASASTCGTSINHGSLKQDTVQLQNIAQKSSSIKLVRDKDADSKDGQENIALL